MDDDMMRRWCDDDLLRARGVPARYLIASWEEVHPPILEPLHEWVCNLGDNLEQGHGITFYGPYGVGKTFGAVLALDAAAGAEGHVDFYVGDGDDKRAHYEPYECEFVLASVMSDILHRPSAEDNMKRIAAWKRCDLLVVDDWHKMYLGHSWDRTQLEAVFDIRHAEMRATVVTINDEEIFDVLPGVQDRLRENSEFIAIGDEVPSRRSR